MTAYITRSLFPWLAASLDHLVSTGEFTGEHRTFALPRFPSSMMGLACRTFRPLPTSRLRLKIGPHHLAKPYGNIATLPRWSNGNGEQAITAWQP